MPAKLRSPLAILAVGAMVFATVFAAASSLTVATDLLPQSGSDLTADCDTDGVNVGYTVSGLNVILKTGNLFNKVHLLTAMSEVSIFFLI